MAIAASLRRDDALVAGLGDASGADCDAPPRGASPGRHSQFGENLFWKNKNTLKEVTASHMPCIFYRI